jgi:hypothetical protein
MDEITIALFLRLNKSPSSRDREPIVRQYASSYDSRVNIETDKIIRYQNQNASLWSSSR